MLLWLRRLAFCSLTLFGVSALQGEELRSLRESENVFFEIVGPDVRSVSWINKLSEHVGRTGFELLSLDNSAVPRQILILLVPDEKVDFSGPYVIQEGNLGFVTLRLKWDESLDLETTIFAVSHSFLHQFVYSNYGPSVLPEMRVWPVSMLAGLSYLRLRPGQALSYMERAESSDQLGLRQLLELEFEERDPLEFNHGAYLMWLVLKRQLTLTSEEYVALILAGLRGAPASYFENQITQIVGLEDDDFDLNEWWQKGLKAELSERYAPFESMAFSHRWLLQLSDFSKLEEVTEGDLLDLRTLWKFRDNETLRKSLIARREMIRIGLSRINPAYFNSAQSLGVLFETVLEGESTHQFIGALARYLTDFSDMRRTQDLIEAVLSEE